MVVSQRPSTMASFLESSLWVESRIKQTHSSVHSNYETTHAETIKCLYFLTCV